MNYRVASTGVGFVLVAVFCRVHLAAAQVESLSVNFHWGNTANAEVNPSPGDGSAGVVNVDGWRDVSEIALLINPVQVTSRLGSTQTSLNVIGLLDDPDPKPNAAATPSGDNEQLMYRGLRSGSSGNSLTVDLSGLDQSFVTNGFNLIAYFVNSESIQYDGTYSLEVDGIKRYGVVTSSFADALDQGDGFSNSGQSDVLGGAGNANYLIFQNLSGRENLQFTLRNETGSRVILQGFQLVSVPEPGCWMLVMGSVIAGLWRRNRHSA